MRRSTCLRSANGAKATKSSTVKLPKLRSANKNCGPKHIDSNGNGVDGGDDKCNQKFISLVWTIHQHTFLIFCPSYRPRVWECPGQRVCAREQYMMTISKKKRIHNIESTYICCFVRVFGYDFCFYFSFFFYYFFVFISRTEQCALREKKKWFIEYALYIRFLR